MAKKPSIDVAVLPPSPAICLGFELTPIALLQRSPQTRDEVALRDEVKRQFGAMEAAVVDFVAAKIAEGSSLDEAFALFSLELPLCFAYERDGSRVRPRYGFRIIERSK